MRNDWKDNSVPEWAGFFTKDEYEEFIILVSKYMHSKKLNFTIYDGIVDVKENTIGFGKMGLDNIARTCKQIPIKDWEYRINYHFDALEKTHAFGKEIDSQKNDFEAMKQYVAVRIYPVGYIAQVGADHFLLKNISEGLVAALVFDYPDSIQNIQEKDIEGWNKEEEELFKIGQENVKKNNSLELNKQAMTGYSVYTVDSDHFFAANIYFELDKLEIIDPEKGALIAFPHRHCSIIYPITTVEVIKAINELIPIIHNMHNEGAGPISSGLFWYKKGKLNPIAYTITDENLTITPSSEFLELLNMVGE